MNFSINTQCLFGSIPLDHAFSIMNKYGYSIFEHWRVNVSEVESIASPMKKHCMRLSAICTDYFTLRDFFMECIKKKEKRLPAVHQRRTLCDISFLLSFRTIYICRF